jgi:predicted DNA-binding transcriptional regulator YafY
MNFGSQCKVIEPEWLIDEILEEAKVVQTHYKNRKRKK